MSIAIYRIVGSQSQWSVEVDEGKLEGEWETREAAFKVAIAAAYNDIKKGFAVEITVPRPALDESAIGGDTKLPSQESGKPYPVEISPEPQPDTDGLIVDPIPPD